MLRLFTRKVLEHSMRFNWRVASRHSSFQATAANTSADRRYMIIDINKGEQSTNCERLKYPLIWLRDNCQCSTCFDAQSKSRTIDWTKFHLKNAHPKSITVSRSPDFESETNNKYNDSHPRHFQIGKQLEVTWLDDHVSNYDVEWLLERSFSAENRTRYLENHYRPQPKLWSKNQFEMKVFQAKEVFEYDEGISYLNSLLNQLTQLFSMKIK